MKANRYCLVVLVVLSTLLLIAAAWRQVSYQKQRKQQEALVWAGVCSNAFQLRLATFGASGDNCILTLPAERAFSSTMRLERGPEGWYACGRGDAQAKISFHAMLSSSTTYDVYAVYNTIESRPFSFVVNGVSVAERAGTATGSDYQPFPSVTAFVARVKLPKGISRLECTWPYATPLFFGLHCVVTTGAVQTADVTCVL